MSAQLLERSLEPVEPDGDLLLTERRRTVVTVPVQGRNVQVTLVNMQGRWLASATTLDGPTLGTDHSPFLAVSQALEPISGQLTDVLLALEAAVA